MATRIMAALRGSIDRRTRIDTAFWLLGLVVVIVFLRWTVTPGGSSRLADFLAWVQGQGAVGANLSDYMPSRIETAERMLDVAGVGPDQVFLENGWAARWEVLDGKRDTVARLKKLAGRTRVVVLATDQDREGEAIAWHLCELLGGRRERFRRVTFNEITRSAIERAFSRPRRIDGRLVDAQNARRFLDRVVGYRASPLLGRRLGAGLAAGRVQSPALRLVVEREREIQAFKPTAYWEVVVAARSSEGDLIEFEVVDGDTEAAVGCASGDRALRFLEEAAASRVVERVREAGRVVVGSVRSAEEVRKPPAPFTTSTLQIGGYVSF